VRTISIINQKGGCGKTTVSINLAAVLASMGHKTLLVDMDPQSHCALGLAVPETQLDRAIGDIHPDGNQHIQMDPYRMLAVAKALDARLVQLDPTNAATYQQRLADFTTRWMAAIARWEAKAAPLKGRSLVVHHDAWVYLEKWLGLQQVGTLEPKPGVPPTSSHLASLIAVTKSSNTLAIISAAYQDPKAGEWLSGRTGVPAVVLPFTVGGDDKATDLFTFYDDTIDRLLAVAKPVAAP
jgi:zinc/manganese transport system substrate-binding protein